MKKLLVVPLIGLIGGCVGGGTGFGGGGDGGGGTEAREYPLGPYGQAVSNTLENKEWEGTGDVGRISFDTFYQLHNDGAKALLVYHFCAT